MSAIYPAVIVFAILLVFIYMLAGRLVANHTGEQQLFSTPFHCLLIGLGLWYMWVLVTGVVVGIPLLTSFILFFLSSLILAFGMFRVFQTNRAVEHFWTKIITSVILLAPFLWWATGDMMTHVDEFTHTMKTASHLLKEGGIFKPEHIERYGIMYPDLPLAATFSILPASLITGGLIQGMPAVFNIILLAATAGALVHAAGVPVRWSNLPLVTAGSILGVTLFNPFFSSNTLLSSAPDTLFAVALFGAFFPLLFKRALPMGWGVLPTALILLLAVGTHQAGILFYGLITSLWIVRNILEKPKYCPSLIFGWVLLIALPLIAWLLWQNFIIGLQVETSLVGLSSTFVAKLVPIFMQHALAAALMAAILVYVAKNLIQEKDSKLFGKIRHALTENAWITTPALAILYILAAAILGFVEKPPHMSDAEYVWQLLSFLQFVLLLPLWMWFRAIYDQTEARKVAFKMPWLIGLGLCAFVLVLQFTQQNRLHINVIAPVRHTLLAASSMRNLPIPSSPYVRWGSPVAALDAKDYTGDKYAHVLAFGLRNHAVVEPAYDLAQKLNFDKNLFHQVLYERGFRHLWIHSADDDIRTKLMGKQLRSDHSYLFAITERGFRKQVAFPHKSYDRPYLK